MVIAIIISLVLGVLLGQFVFTPEISNFFASISDSILILLMFSVGIAVGTNKAVFQKLKQNNLLILVIPIGIITGSLMGGIICSFILGIDINIGTAIASGLGWYSLSGVMVTDLAGAQAGTIAFLSNLMRETIAFISIPFLCKYLNHYTAIAPAAATSEDTTLPIIMKYGSEEVVIMAVLNGILCSAAVPFLIQICYRFF